MRYSRQEVLNEIQMQLGNVTQRVTIDECPNELRHACMQTGVTKLPMRTFNVPLEGGGNIQYPFYYCQYCGKLYAYRHLYD